MVLLLSGRVGHRLLFIFLLSQIIKRLYHIDINAFFMPLLQVKSAVNYKTQIQEQRILFPKALSQNNLARIAGVIIIVLKALEHPSFFKAR